MAIDLIKKNNFIKELQECKKILAFEFKIINDDFLFIGIEYDKNKDIFYWNGLEKKEKFNIDYEFSLDLNLQALYDDVLNHYINVVDFT